MTENYKLKKIHETKKSIFYENPDYILKVTQGGFVLRKNKWGKPWFNDNYEEGELIQAPVRKMTLTNKETNKSTTKRVYQDTAIMDMENDFEKKSQFADMFAKIDPPQI